MHQRKAKLFMEWRSFGDNWSHPLPTRKPAAMLRDKIELWRQNCSTVVAEAYILQWGHTTIPQYDVPWWWKIIDEGVFQQTPKPSKSVTNFFFAFYKDVRDVVLWCQNQATEVTKLYHKDKIKLPFEKHICHLEFKEFEPNPFQLIFRKWNVNMVIQDLGILLVFWQHRKKRTFIFWIVLYSLWSPAYFGEVTCPRRRALF